MSDDKGKLAQRWERAKAMTCLAFGVSTPEQAIMMGAGVQYAELFQEALDQVQREEEEAEDRANCGDMRRVIDGAVGREREACAKIADAKAEQIDSCGDDYDPVMAVAEVADAIRARGEVKMNGTWSVGVTAIRGTLGASGGYPGIYPSLPGKPETYPPIALTSVFPNGILVDGAGNLLSPSMAGRQAREGDRRKSPRINPGSGVRAGDYYYAIDRVGIYRLPVNSNTADRSFASPVAGYLEEKGLGASNIEKVYHDERSNAVLYQFPTILLPFMLDTGVWSTPLERSDYEMACSDFESALRKSVAHLLPEPIKVQDPSAHSVPLSFDANGIKEKQATCSRCDGALSPDRVAVCKACSPDQQ